MSEAAKPGPGSGKTPAGKAFYSQATEAVYKKWSAAIGADLVRAAEAAVAEPNAVQ